MQPKSPAPTQPQQAAQSTKLNLNIGNIPDSIYSGTGQQGDPNIPHESADGWNGFGQSVGHVEDFFLKPLERVSASLDVLGLAGTGFVAKQTGNLLNTVGLSKAGSAAQNFGQGAENMAQKIGTEGMPTVGGGTVLPIGAKAGYDAAQEMQNGEGAAGAYTKAALKGGAEGTAVGAQIAAYGSGSAVGLGSWVGLSTALNDLSQGDITKASTYTNALLDGVVSGSVTGLAAGAFGLVMNKAAVPFFKWVGNKLAADSGSPVNVIAKPISNFVNSLFSRVPEIATSAEGGETQSIAEILGENSNAYKALVNEHADTMDNVFKGVGDAVKEDIQAPTAALSDAQNQIRSTANNIIQTNQAKFADLKNSVSIPTATLTGENSEFSQTLKDAQDFVLKSYKEGTEPSMLQDYLGKVQGLIQNPKGNLSLDTLMRAADNGSPLVGANQDETTLIGDLSNSLRRDVLGYLSTQDPVAAARWGQYTMESRNITQNIYSPFAKDFMSTAQMGRFTSDITKGSGPTLEELQGFKQLMGGDSSGKISSLLYNAAIDKAQGMGAEDGSKFLTDFVGKYETVLDPSHAETLTRMADFGKGNLEDTVNWIQTLQGKTPAMNLEDTTAQVGQKNTVAMGNEYDKMIASGDAKAEDVYKDVQGKILQPDRAQAMVSDTAANLDKFKPGLGEQLTQKIDVNNASPESISTQALSILKDAEPLAPLNQSDVTNLASQQKLIKNIDQTGFIDAVDSGDYKRALTTLAKASTKGTQNPEFLTSVTSLMTDEQRVALASQMKTLKSTPLNRQFIRSALGVVAGLKTAALYHGAIGVTDDLIGNATNKEINSAVEALLSDSSAPKAFTQDWFANLGKRFLVNVGAIKAGEATHETINPQQ